MDRRCSSCHVSKELTINFYRYKRGLAGYQAQCKLCMRRYKRTKNPKVIKEKKRTAGYRVLSCPDKVYAKGVTFSAFDFLTSLAGMVWPVGMIVEDINTLVQYEIMGYSLREL